MSLFAQVGGDGADMASLTIATNATGTEDWRMLLPAAKSQTGWMNPGGRSANEKDQGRETIDWRPQRERKARTPSRPKECPRLCPPHSRSVAETPSFGFGLATKSD